MTKTYFILMVRFINLLYDVPTKFRIGRIIYTVTKRSETWYVVTNEKSKFVFINGNFGIVRFDEDDDSILYDILDMFMALSKGK